MVDMDRFELYNIAERYIELVNPFTPEKILTVGKVLGLKTGSRVIEFGSGYGEVLALWAKAYGIKGIGIDIREHCCRKAKDKMAKLGLGKDIQIVHANGAEYRPERKDFDFAACIGASFIWGDFERTVKAMKSMIKRGGKLAIGEPFWKSDTVPERFRKREATVRTEPQLLRTIRKEGFELEFVVTSSQDDWDNYMANNWRGLIAWLQENPDHPDRKDVHSKLRNEQDEYFEYIHPYMGWAVYILCPK
jgi:ubiquinone/menaquinone biosynthesis C-methylase UbiE